MEKKELKEEIKKVLEGKSIYEMSPISGLNPMTKEEIIYWIVETYIDQELDKAREEKIQNIFTREEWGLMYESLIYRFGNDKEFKHLEQKILGMRKLSKLKDNK